MPFTQSPFGFADSNISLSKERTCTKSFMGFIPCNLKEEEDMIEQSSIVGEVS